MGLRGYRAIGSQGYESVGVKSASHGEGLHSLGVYLQARAVDGVETSKYTAPKRLLMRSHLTVTPAYEVGLLERPLTDITGAVRTN
eukprot:7280863-Pyramimonas_sp.AAC.1